MHRFRRAALVLAAVVCASLAAVAVSGEQLAVKFSLDWKFEGPSAAYLLALDKGYYAAEGLDVTIDTGQGSLEAIPRVASGVYQFGFADINSLIKFQDKNPDVGIKGILMVYDAPPFAIVTLAKTGIETPRDLEGRILGAPAPDGAYAQWKAFVKENGIDASKVTIENVGFPLREPMLVSGQVDAITGFSFSSFLNLKAKGVPPDEIRVFLMSDYGLDLYGNTIIVNPEFAAENPEAVAGFVRATIKGGRIRWPTRKPPCSTCWSATWWRAPGRAGAPGDEHRRQRPHALRAGARLRQRRPGAAGDLDRADRRNLRLQRYAAGSRGRVHQRVSAGCSGAYATVAPQWARVGREARRWTRLSSCATSA